MSLLNAEEELYKIRELARESERLVLALGCRLSGLPPLDKAAYTLHELERAKCKAERDERYWQAAHAKVKEELEEVKSGRWGMESENRDQKGEREERGIKDLESKLEKEKDKNWDLNYEKKEQEVKIKGLERKLEKEEKRNRELRDKNRDQEDRIKDLVDQNWELSCKGENLEVKIKRLETKLRNSIPLDYEQTDLPVVKTAREAEQEERINMLEQELGKMKKEVQRNDGVEE